MRRRAAVTAQFDFLSEELGAAPSFRREQEVLEKLEKFDAKMEEDCAPLAFADKEDQGRVMKVAQCSDTWKGRAVQGPRAVRVRGRRRG